VGGGELVPAERKPQDPPAGRLSESGEREIRRDLLLERALCRLSRDHIRSLTKGKKGAFSWLRVHDDLDTAPVLKEHLLAILGAGNRILHGVLSEVVDLLVAEGRVPRRVRVPRDDAVDWTRTA
jgi:hypothetical protein